MNAEEEEEEEEGGEHAEEGNADDTGNPENPEKEIASVPPVTSQKNVADGDDDKVERLSFSESNLNIACKLRVPTDHNINPIYKCYLPSEQTRLLSSERRRKIFAEAFCANDDDEKKDKKTVRRLTSLCLDALVPQYKRGNFNQLKDPELREQFGERLSTNLLLIDILDLDIMSFWKKIYFEMCPDALLLFKKRKSFHEDWKCLGIQEKFRDLLENSKFEEWNELAMTNLAKAVSKCITTLVITHLKPLEEYSIERDPILVDYKIWSTPVEDCHHINLELVGELKNLTYLHIEFQPSWLGYKYDYRFFNFSYRDMDNLVRALVKLPQLKKFTLRRSIMDNKKLIVLTGALATLENLESIDLSYCELKDESGWTLAQLLNEQTAIKSLELAGNSLGALGTYSLMYGVQNYAGFLEYLGLARNPITEEGVVGLARALNNSKQVTHLNLTGVIVSEYGAALVAEFLRCPLMLTKLDMCGIPLGKEGGKHLLRSLDKNRTILELMCRGCDMTAEQEFKVELLLRRNNYLHMLAPITSAVPITPEERKKLDEELTEWVSATKQPVLLKAQEKFKNRKECKGAEEKIEDLPANIPIFIPKKAQVQKSNMNLLSGEYYQVDNENEPFDYNPSNLTEEDILRHCDIGAFTK